MVIKLRDKEYSASPTLLKLAFLIDALTEGQKGNDFVVASPASIMRKLGKRSARQEIAACLLEVCPDLPPDLVAYREVDGRVDFKLELTLEEVIDFFVQCMGLLAK
jgi:hypothetical protein